MAVGASGLAVMDISDPTNPGAPSYKDTNDDAQEVAIDGSYAFVADGTSGLAVIPLSKRSVEKDDIRFWNPKP